MRPIDISDDFRLLNDIIGEDNFKQKDNYQKLIREITKEEFITFHALLIDISAHSDQR